MKNTNWILIDTETTGFNAPIFVVELGAQKMRGWAPEGPSFRRLLNQNTDIPSEAARVHGYTREILERDGESAESVYREFSAYAGNLPIVAYNLEYDLDKVLKPEWKRLGIKNIGTEGFCALKLAQRLLDPVPAGNCKLQTLRQYYRLPERGAHTALGDVDTVADLLESVLRPIAESRGIQSWEDICSYSNATWYPSRITFGKHKGRSFLEARNDRDLRNWLEWLSDSSNKRTAGIGQWYLKELERSGDQVDDYSEILTAFADSTNAPRKSDSKDNGSGIIIYVNPEIEQLRTFVANARSRLAEIEAQYSTDRSAVEFTRSIIFNSLRKYYQKRDQLRLVIDYRSRYLKILVQVGEEEADEVANEFESAKTQSESDYDDAASEAAERKSLTEEEEGELKTLWLKLVRLYHPDRFAGNSEQAKVYDQLVMEINLARDNGDIAVLREIANDPHGFIMSHGWTSLDFSESGDLKKLKKLLETLNIKIISTMELMGDLHESPDYELHQLSLKDPSLLEEVSVTQAKQLEEEIDELALEAKRLEAEIEELTGSVPIQES